MTTVLDHPDAIVRIEECGGGRREISVEAKDRAFIPVRRWETAYPPDLVEHVLRVKGLYVADEIMRDEAPFYVEHHFKWDILSYVDRADFTERRLLDFGCGSGASTVVLARMLPDSTQFTGVELVPEFVELARHRARYHGIDTRAAFHLSPGPRRLPEEMGQVDFVLFSAVYEHLLEPERREMLPLVWRHLKPGGILFLDQTPYRWFPIEMHTTGLPLINYLPDSVAHWTARRFSSRVGSGESWEQLLRRGIRGGTIREILSVLNKTGRSADLLMPSRQGVQDHIDLWFQLSSTVRARFAKRLMKWGFRAVKASTGISLIPTLSLAFRKVR